MYYALLSFECDILRSAFSLHKDADILLNVSIWTCIEWFFHKFISKYHNIHIENLNSRARHMSKMLNERCVHPVYSFNEISMVNSLIYWSLNWSKFACPFQKQQSKATGIEESAESACTRKKRFLIWMCTRNAIDGTQSNGMHCDPPRSSTCIV